MKKDLKVTLVQAALAWEDVAANIRTFQRRLATVKPGETDLVILPEMFSTGFSMRAEMFAEKEGGSAMQWMADTAAQLKCVVTGSLMLREKQKYYNRLIWMRPDGSYESYDKRHLFRMGKESETYTAGKDGMLFDVKGWNVCPQICYDLRFPVWSRNRVLKKGNPPEYEFDLLIYVANWPAVRHFAWQQLLIARAIENQAYVIGVNRTGTDINAMEHAGGSCAVDPLGNTLFNAGKKNAVRTITLDYRMMHAYRKKFPALLDADVFSVH